MLRHLCNAEGNTEMFYGNCVIRKGMRKCVKTTVYYGRDCGNVLWQLCNTEWTAEICYGNCVIRMRLRKCVMATV